MNGFGEYTMGQEQYRDQLREAERHRLSKLVADDCQESRLGHALMNLVSGITKSLGSRDRVPCGEYGLLAEKAA
jgi:hypothetical protein